LFTITYPFTNTNSVKVKTNGPHGQTATLSATLVGSNQTKTANVSACSGIGNMWGDKIVWTDTPTSNTHGLNGSYSADWTVSPGFVFHPSGNTTLTNTKTVQVKATNPQGQTGTLTATVNGVGVVTKTIKQCYSILGPDVLCVSDGSVYYYLFNGISGLITADLWLNEQGIYFPPPYIYQNTSMALVASQGYGQIAAVLQAVINGEVVARKDILVCGSKSGGSQNDWIKIYPNPTSGILNIEINAGDDTQQQKTAPVYDVRLYDGQGNLLRQEKTTSSRVEFNISDLINGVYFVHVYDGVSKLPEIRLVVVEH